MKTHSIAPLILLLLLSLTGSLCYAGELSFNIGGGPQVTASQTNRTAGVDFSFWSFKRSPRQELSLGTSYTYAETNEGDNRRLHAFSIYPQLTLFAPRWRGMTPIFVVRALAPIYLSNNQLGDREQGKHFAFQAMVGVGLRWGDRQQWQANINYKHFSNANLSSPNDGIDFPLVFSISQHW